MDLKSFLPGEKSPIRDDYWSLVIEPEWVQAGIWTVSEGKAEVMAVSHPFAWQEDGELLSSVDAVLSSAVQSLPEDTVEPTKTVFGVTFSWVENGEIKPEYLEKIKLICSKLELTPVGFVVLQEAISHFVKSEEGASLNGIVVFLAKDNIEVSLFRMGNQIGNMMVSRSVSVVDDIAEGLSRFNEISPLPSRIILYDGREGELDNEKQVIINADWSNFEKIQFLHTPRVETIDPEKKVLAVCLAGGLEISQVDKVVNLTQNDTAEVEKVEEMVLEEGLENVVPTKAPDLGFYVNEDVTKMESSAPTVNSVPVYQQPQFQTTPAYVSKESLMDKIKSKVRSMIKPRNLPKPKIAWGGGNDNKKIFISGAVALILLFIAGFAFWWYAPKVDIKIFVSPQNTEETTSMFVDTNAKMMDVAGKVIPGETVTQKKSGSKEKRVTGSKIVGDKAKGQVKLFRSGNEIKLPAGTVITSSNNLAFSLDSETTIASGSASTPGTKVVGVTAQKIGTESNLSSGTSFKVDNYPTSDIEAKNESTFIGGSSREISAVSEDDQKELEEGLLIELKNGALTDTENNLGEEKYLVRESLIAKIKEQSFNAKVGDEATNIKLDLTIETTAIVVSKKDLIAFGKEVLGPKVPKDYVLRDDKLVASFESVGGKDGKYELNVTLKAILLPSLNIDEIKNNIKGKYSRIAGEYLRNITSVSEVKIILTPPFPGRLSVIPRIPSKINIEIDTK